jgi:hypothetical protein
VSRGGGRPPRRRTLVAILAVLAAVLMPVPVSEASAGLGDIEGPGDVELDMVAVGPDVLAPGATLSVTVVVRNEGTETLSEPLVRLKLAPRLLSSRDAVAAWATAQDDEFSGSRVAEVPLPEPVGPGEEVTVPLTVLADDLPLSGEPSAWGPRGVAVAVLDADFAQVALARTHVVWFPGRSFSSPVRTSVLVPISGVAPDVTTGLVPADELDGLTSDGGRLASVLASASTPGVTWALDPALLASAAALDPSASPGPPADPGPTSWLEQLRTAAAGREIVALPYADPDVTALASAGQGGLYGLAQEQGHETLRQLLGEPARTDVTWPVGGSVDQAALEVLSSDGRGAVVLSQGAQPLVRDLPFTPTGRGRLAVDDTSVASLLVDTPLSTTLADAGRDPRGIGTAEAATDDLLAVQRLLAETAAITMERPSVERHVLVTAPRDWDPDPQTGARALTALTAVPWVQATPLGALLDTAPPDVDRGSLTYGPADAAGELPTDGLQAVGSALAATRRLAPALTGPQEVLTAAERSAVTATSAAWRGDLDRWRRQVQVFVDTSSDLLRGVQVVPGSAINVLSARADLPLTVSNSLDQDVRVEVWLQPGSPRLVADRAVPVTVAAGGSERVSVPVRALASGDTDVQVQLRTPDGEVIGEPVALTVRVRADWENRGTLGLAVVAALVLVVGLVRTIRRGRRTAGAPPLGTQPPAPVSRRDGS